MNVKKECELQCRSPKMFECLSSLESSYPVFYIIFKVKFYIVSF